MSSRIHMGLIALCAGGVAVAAAACSKGQPPQPPAPPSANAASGPTAASTVEGAVYACPMHPDQTAHEPGRCATCGMHLVEKGAPGAP